MSKVLSFLARAVVYAIMAPFQLARGFLVALGILPSVPPPEIEAAEEFAEIARLTDEAQQLDDEVTVKLWAAARLSHRPFPLPDGRIGQWLASLTTDDAGRIATADARGKLRGHLDGTELVADLPPVGSFADTVRWRKARAPLRARREDRQPQAKEDALDAFTTASPIDHTGP